MKLGVLVRVVLLLIVFGCVFGPTDSSADSKHSSYTNINKVIVLTGLSLWNEGSDSSSESKYAIQLKGFRENAPIHPSSISNRAKRIIGENGPFGSFEILITSSADDVPIFSPGDVLIKLQISYFEIQKQPIAVLSTKMRRLSRCTREARLAQESVGSLPTYAFLVSKDEEELDAELTRALEATLVDVIQLFE